MQAGCRKLVVVVFNDSAMAMIEVKQRRRQLAPRGMAYSPTDFATVARGYGCAGIRVDDPGQLDAAMRAAFAMDRPVVVDVAIDRHAYHAVLRALRG